MDIKFSAPLEIHKIWHTAIMRIVTITWARNEADILEEFVRYHANIVDKMIVIDNASTDESVAMLQRLQEEGLPLQIKTNDSTFHNQGPVLTEVMHTLSVSEQPDWILPLDADEFLMCANGTVREVIETLSPHHVYLLPWRTYVPTASDDATEQHILRRITHRRSAETPQYRKILIPRAFHGNEFTIPLGSHTLQGNAVTTQLIDTLMLAHFPVRSTAQIKRKITEGWERHRKNPHAKPGENYHWEKLYDEMTKGKPSPRRLEEIALRYATTSDAPINVIRDPLSTRSKGLQ